MAEDSSWDPGEKYKNMFAEKLAAELEADVDDIQDNIYDEDMKTPSGVPYYFYYDSETASTNYMGVIGGKPTAIVYTDHGGGGDDNEIEMSVNDRVRYVIKYGDPEQGATLNAIMPAKMVKGFPVAPRKVVAQTKPGQDWQAMIGLGLDMLWNRMQHKFLETADVTDYNPPSQGGTRQELVAKYHQTKDPKDAEAARRAGATQQELQGVAEGTKLTRGSKVQIPYQGKLVSGTIVRYDPGSEHESPFYIVDVGTLRSEKVPAHKIEGGSVKENLKIQGVAEGDNLATFVGPNEDSTDAMDHRGAVTDSFYEDLARIKSLALSKSAK